MIVTYIFVNFGTMATSGKLDTGPLAGRRNSQEGVVNTKEKELCGSTFNIGYRKMQKYPQV